MKTLYLMRHGQTMFNVAHKIQGWCDAPLTDLGRAQAEVAGQWFRDRNITFDYAYSSTSERAADTLEIVTGGQMPYERIRGLKEWFFGKLEGHDESLNPSFPYGDQFKQYGGEGEKEFQERFSDTVTGIMNVSEDNTTTLIVAHGAEEWGMSGTEFDWTRGAWEMINTAHPEWAGKTLSMFNFELCAFDDGQEAFMISCVPEYRTLVAELVADGTLNAAVVGRAGGVSGITFDTTTMEDGISYRNAGVPYFLNVTDTCIQLDLPEGEYGWSQLHYHTDSDDASTYDETTMRNNISVFGAILLTIDREPALRLDLTQACLDLDAAMEPAYAEEAGVDVQAWKDGMAEMLDAAKAHNAKIADINARYASAEDNAEREAIRAEGVALNARTLAAFKFVQDAFIGIEFSSDVVQRHEGYLDNVVILDTVIEALEAGELSNDDETGALDAALWLNALSEYGYYIFTPQAADMQGVHTDAALGNSQLWGKGKGFVYAQTWPATVSLLQKAETEENDFTEELTIYRSERDKQLALMGEVMEQEITAMTELTALLMD